MLNRSQRTMVQHTVCALSKALVGEEIHCGYLSSQVRKMLDFRAGAEGRSRLGTMTEMEEKCTLARLLKDSLAGLRQRTPFFVKVNQRVLCHLGKAIEETCERPTPDKARES